MIKHIIFIYIRFSAVWCETQEVQNMFLSMVCDGFSVVCGCLGCFNWPRKSKSYVYLPEPSGKSNGTKLWRTFSLSSQHQKLNKGGNFSSQFCYERALLPSIICLGRLHIASKYIFNLWQLRQGVDSLAQWLEHWIFNREDRFRFPGQAWEFFQLCFIPLLQLSCRKNLDWNAAANKGIQYQLTFLFFVQKF